MNAIRSASPSAQPVHPSELRVDLNDGRVIVVSVHCEALPIDQESFQMPVIREATYAETIIALRSLLPAGIE
jgi:hypothetical protein